MDFFIIKVAFAESMSPTRSETDTECAVESKIFNIYTKMSSDDEYYTPPEHWIAVKDFLPGSDRIVWEAFAETGGAAAP